MLELQKINKSYNKNGKQINVLNNVNYSFFNNKFYCIVGKSGSGKTTLIQILGLLLDTNSGKILFDNQEIEKLTNNQKADIRNQKIGFVFQSFYLNPLMKAYENVMLPLYLNKNINNSERKKIAYNLLKELGLEGRELHYPRELSGGEQQRVAIARALVNNPNIILADEPTGSLDSENEKNILKILKNLARNGKCVIVVSHSDNVKKYADVVLEINNCILSEVAK